MKIPQLSIKARLILTLGLASALLLAVGGVGILNQRRSNESLRDMYVNKLVPATVLGELLEGYGSERALVMRAATGKEPAILAKASSAVHDDRAGRHEAWKRITSAELGDGERAVAARFEADRNALEKDTDAALAAMHAHDFSAAVSLLDGSGEKHYDALKHDVLKLFEIESSVSKTVFHADERRVHTATVFSIAGIGLGLGISVLFSVLLIRSLTRSLNTAVRVADSIADGQLGHDIDIRSSDELGRLLMSLKHMDERLTEITRAVREGATEVTVASGQIAQGTDDLSRRTQEQASSLEETAASMEEMTSTVKHNADNASQADQLARGARRQAEEGGEVVREAVAAMTEVSESSRRIADIVGLIDEIAFQTNLLSLNAAVEAARAGEQGRGFAVVASEVRNLAQRSAGAAREIKTLIGESVERVRVGQELVDRSGHTLSDIVDGVKKLTDIVAEMAAASAEQSTGIDQVNTAVMTMDEVTQQNSALVEESAAATRAMQEQAEGLLRQVEYFRFNGDEAKAARERGAVAAGGAVTAQVSATVNGDAGRAVAEMIDGALASA